MAKPKVDAKIRDEDAAATSWGFGFLASENDAQIQSRHAFYMFEFRVRKCPLFRTHSCKHCKPFSCRYAHYENQTRRVPKLVGETWSYDVQLCSANSLLECPQGLKCGLSHRLQKENIYHPSVYKTKVCEHPLVSCGPPQTASPYASTQAVDFFPPASQEWFQCSEYGIHCAKAHGPKDLRIVPGSENINSDTSPATHASSPPSLASSSLTSSPSSSSPVFEPLSGGAVAVPRISSTSSLPRISSSNSLHRASSSASLARISSSSALPRVASSASLAAIRNATRSPPLVLRPSTREDSYDDEDDDNEGERKKSRRDSNNGSSTGKSNSSNSSNSSSSSGSNSGSSSSSSSGGSGGNAGGRRGSSDNSTGGSRRNSDRSSSRSEFSEHEDKSARKRDENNAEQKLKGNSSSSSDDTQGEMSKVGTEKQTSNKNVLREGRSNSLTDQTRPSSHLLYSSRSSSSLAILDAPHLEHTPSFTPASERKKSSSFYAPDGDLVIHTYATLEVEEQGRGSESTSSQGLRRVDSNHSLRRVESSQSLRRVDSAAELDPNAGNCSGWMNAHAGQEPPPECVAHSHQIYLDSFRVRMCVDFLGSKCNFNSRTCFHAHHQRNRRRRPLLVNGRFNYIATRCPTLERERTCPVGAACHYAHTAEEVVYHPSKYKTHMCAYSLGRDQACSEYGMHCAKAHGPEDKRDAVLGDEEISRNDDHAQFMFEYKTKPCEGYVWDCHNRQYHNVKERRRLLVNVRYVPDPCPNVLVGQKWGAPNIHCRDESGNRIDPVACGEHEEWRCFLAHTPNEIAYHPLLYKTVACEAFDRNHPCDGQYCTRSHGASDKRSQHTAREWKTQILSREQASSQRLSRTGSYALLPRSGPTLPRNASYPSLKSSNANPAPIVSSAADTSYSPSPSPSFTSPRRTGTRFAEEEGTHKRSDSTSMRQPSQDRERTSTEPRNYVDPVQPRVTTSNPYSTSDHETTPGCFAPFSFGLGLSGAFENSLWVRPRGEDIWRPPDKPLAEPFSVRPAAVDCETGAGPWCSCSTFKAKLSCKHVAPVLPAASPPHSQSSSDSPHHSPPFNFPSLAMPILSSCSQQAPSPHSYSSFSPPFSPPPATPPQSIPVVDPDVYCSCARFLQVGTCKHISRPPPNNSPPKSSSIVDSATAAAAQLSWRAEELMDHSHRKLSGYMGSLGDRIEEGEWFRKPKSVSSLPSTIPSRTSTLSTLQFADDLMSNPPKPLDSLTSFSNSPPPAYSSSIESSTSSSGTLTTTTTSSMVAIPKSTSSRDLKKTSELIAEAKMKGLGVSLPSRSSSPSLEANTNSPSSSSASLLRKSLSKLPAIRLPDVKALFPTWPPPRAAPSSQTPTPPPSFFDSSEPVVEEELEPAGLSEPPSPSQPQPQGMAWASTPLDFSVEKQSQSPSSSASSDPPNISYLPVSEPRFEATSSPAPLDPFSLGLSCKFPQLFPVRPHMLVNPVSLQCCGLCLCRSCAASISFAASSPLTCKCGASITSPVLEKALAAPSNQALMAILSVFAAQHQPP